MKTQSSSEDDQELHAVLATWQVHNTLPPRFQDRVWQRIQRCETQPGASVWMLLRRGLETALARPSLAVGYVTVLLAVGLLTGFWQARQAQARTFESFSVRYVQMLDPYQMPRN